MPNDDEARAQRANAMTQELPVDAGDAPGSASGVAPAHSATRAEAGEPDAGRVDMVGSTPPPPPRKEDPYVGKTFDGRYVIERILGEGGMGVVYLARHRMIDKKVAVKVVRGNLARDKEVTERFLQEARAASSVGNPHIVDVSDFGELPDGSTYFVMEYLDGEGLGKALEKQKPMPPTRAAHIARQVALGLSAAHAAGIVHRDLKPDNVMLVKRGTDRDFVKILDFGIAKVGGEASRLTRQGSVFGTPHYMSPEQAAGAPVDLRTDVYALGVILYEMASGRVPFDADNYMGILTQHMYKAPVPIRALVPTHDVPPGLDAIILKCLSKKPDLRYASMDELVADFDLLAKGMLPAAVEEMMSRSGGFNVPADYFRNGSMPAPVPATPSSPRRRWGLYAGVAGVTTAVALVGFVLVRSASSSADADHTPAAVATAVPSAASSAVPSVTPASEPPAKKQVLLSAEPVDATFTRDGVDLGTPPIAIEVTPGEVVTVTVAKAGYKAQTITLDGSEAKRVVKLAAAASPRGTPKAAATPKPGGGFSDFQDPWKK